RAEKSRRTGRTAHRPFAITRSSLRGAQAPLSESLLTPARAFNKTSRAPRRLAPGPVQEPPNQRHAAELSREDRRANLDGEVLGEIEDGVVHALGHLEEQHVAGALDDAEPRAGDQRAKLLGELRRREAGTAAAH